MIDLDAIAPAKGDKYSQNLHKWLSNRREKHRLNSRVFTRKTPDGWRDGMLVGHYDNEMVLSATGMIDIMCRGNGATLFCYGRLPVTEMPDFWANYERIGRCIFDPKHMMGFSHDATRWKTDGDARSCLWCGECVQHLRRWQETIERAQWENTTTT